MGEWRNGRRAGLRSRCRVSGVEVRPRSRLPGRACRRRAAPRGPPTASALYCPGDADHHHPGPQLHVVLEIELPAERLDRAIDEAVRHLSRRTRVPGFRPGKAPAADPRAPARARRGPRRRGRAPRPGRLPRGPRRGGHPAADQRRRRGRPGRGGQAAHLQGDRPGPARGRARRLQGLQLRPEIETIDDARVDKVLEELRDQNATLAAVEGRGAQDGDYAVISFVGTRDGEPFEGGTLGADADHPRPGAADPGLRGEPARPRGRRLDRVRHHLPRRLPGDRAGREARPFRGRDPRAAREGPAGAR